MAVQMKLVDDFTPSDYQKNIFDFIKHGTGNGVINAVAGSGKTTTLLKALNYIPSDKKIVFCAFNKHIANELKEKAPENVWSTTLHGAGMRSMMMSKHHPTVDMYKQNTIFDQILKYDRTEIKEINNGYFQQSELESNYFYSVRDAVDMMKASMLPENIDSLRQVVEFYDLDMGSNQRLFEFFVFKSMQLSAQHPEVINFSDMIWLPLKLKLYIPQFDYVFIDELQDLNMAQIELALKMCNDTGRIIGAGDPFQSLYGFMGAAPDAMDRTTTRIDATILPLSISYRCPTSHIKLAQTYVPYIEASPAAEAGSVFHINGEEFLNTIKPGDMVICRNNAPLIEYAFETLKRGYKVNIRGKDIGHGLMTIVKKANVSTTQELIRKLDTWKKVEMERALQEKKNPNRIEDKYKALMALCSKTKYTKELIDYIRKLFSDENQEIVFSSVHRAKGMESKRIFIIQFNLIPCRWAKQAWEMEQEKNIAYVAVTRSKEELFFVGE